MKIFSTCRRSRTFNGSEIIIKRKPVDVNNLDDLKSEIDSKIPKNVGHQSGTVNSLRVPVLKERKGSRRTTYRVFGTFSRTCSVRAVFALFSSSKKIPTVFA